MDKNNRRVGSRTAAPPSAALNPESAHVGLRGLPVPSRVESGTVKPMYVKQTYSQLVRKTPPEGSGGGAQGGSGDAAAAPMSDWPAMLAAAKTAVRNGITSWAALATLESSNEWGRGGVLSSGIAGPAARGDGGELQSDVDFRSTIEDALESAGATAEVAKAFAEETWTLFQDWADAYKVVALHWYPAFLCYPGMQAPAMPNAPTPVGASGMSTGSSTLLSPSDLETRFTNALGVSAMAEPGAPVFVSRFCSAFSLAFAAWQVSSKWINVLGSGPVHGYAPPFVPCGPVQGGIYRGAAGCLSAETFPLW